MATATKYPKKLFYRIQEVANIVGVEAYVLRYWETKFPMLNPEKDGNDQRRYRQKEIELLLRIKELLHGEKYTIAGAVEKLKDERGPGHGARKHPEEHAAPPGTAAQDEALDLFRATPPEGADSATPGFSTEDSGLSEEQLRRVRRVREELGLLKRELQDWRDEMG